MEMKDYINQEFAKGSSKEEIKNVLFASGYSEEEIVQAFAEAQNDKGSESNFSKLPGATDILRESIVEYKLNWRRYLGIVFLSFLIYLPAGFVILFAISVGSSLVFSLVQNLIVKIAIVLLAVVGVVIANMVFAWGRIALEFAVLNRSNNVGVIDSLRDTFRKIPQYFWVNFLQSVVVFLIVVLFITLNSFTVFLSSSLNISSSVISFVSAAGVIIGGVFAIIFATWFAFSTYIYLVEGERGARALLKSREYVRGMWIGVFGRVLYIFAIFGLLYFFIQLLLRSSSIALSLLAGIIAIIFLVFSPVAVVYSCFLYLYVKRVKVNISFQPSRKSVLIVNGIGILAIFVPIVAIVLVMVAFSTISQSFPPKGTDAEEKSLIVPSSFPTRIIEYQPHEPLQ